MPQSLTLDQVLVNRDKKLGHTLKFPLSHIIARQDVTQASYAVLRQLLFALLLNGRSATEVVDVCTTAWIPVSSHHLAAAAD